MGHLNHFFYFMHQGLYSQHFIFLGTLKWAHKAIVIVCGEHFQPSVLQQPSILGSFVSYEENYLNTTPEYGLGAIEQINEISKNKNKAGVLYKRPKRPLKAVECYQN